MRIKTRRLLVAYTVLWLVWSAWEVFILPALPMSVFTALFDAAVVKPIVWLSPLIYIRYVKGERLLRPFFPREFPWLACLVLLLASAAFLYTLRLANGLAHTQAVFDPLWLVYSLSAGVIEELSFRGFFYACMERVTGFWPAALTNGALFMLYHFPALLLGQWRTLLSLRTLLLFAMGVVFCLMLRRWKNLVLNMAVHTVWDLLSFLFCLVG